VARHEVFGLPVVLLLHVIDYRIQTSGIEIAPTALVYFIPYRRSIVVFRGVP
jgi:hypothetical protein